MHVRLSISQREHNRRQCSPRRLDTYAYGAIQSVQYYGRLFARFILNTHFQANFAITFSFFVVRMCLSISPSLRLSISSCASTDHMLYFVAGRMQLFAQKWKSG